MKPVALQVRPSFTPLVLQGSFFQREMKKVVLKLDLHDDKAKKKAMKAVSSLSGIDSIAIDMKERKLTVTGNVDPVTIARKLRKISHTEIVSVGPAKEEKKDDGKEDGGGKKDDRKEYGGGKKDEKKNPDEAYRAYNPYMSPYYHVVRVEENQNSCVIC